MSTVALVAFACMTNALIILSACRADPLEIRNQQGPHRYTLDPAATPPSTGIVHGQNLGETHP